jgi:hypothetical protein
MALISSGHLPVSLLDRHAVTPLLSPPRTPRYNGSAQAGIGALKAYALAIAAAHARPDCWSCQDLEAARVEANRDGRPRGLTGPCPQELWNQRAPILDPDRQRFQLAVCAAFADETQLLAQSIVLPPGQTPAVAFGAFQRAVLTRRAIRQTLIQFGLLSVRRIAN